MKIQTCPLIFKNLDRKPKVYDFCQMFVVANRNLGLLEENRWLDPYEWKIYEKAVRHPMIFYFFVTSTSENYTIYWILHPKLDNSFTQAKGTFHSGANPRIRKIESGF